MFLGLLDPHPDPDPSSTSKKKEEKSQFLLFCDFYYDFLYLKNDVNVPSKRKKHKYLVKKIIF
jgi:hypothetical protein